MAQSANPLRVILPEATLSFPHLFEPHRMDERQDFKYSCELIFDQGADLRKLQAAIQAAAVEKFKDQIPPNLKTPIRPGSDRKYDSYAGKVFVSARSTDRPGVVSGPGRDPVVDTNEVYPGCVVIVSVTAFGYDKSGNKGVALALNNVWKIRDGERLDSRVDADEEFADLPPVDFGTSAFGQPAQQPPSNMFG